MRLAGTIQDRLVQELLIWTTEFADRGVRTGRIGRINSGLDLSFASGRSDDLEDTREQLVEGDECDGIIARISENRSFGFIGIATGDDLFFHQSFVTSRSHCIYMGVGVHVEFRVGVNARGFCAKEVRLKFRKDLEQLNTEGQSTKACVVFRREGTEYGFAIIPEYGQLLIRKEDFSIPNEWLSLKEGDQINLIVDQSEKGYLGRNISIVID